MKFPEKGPLEPPRSSIRNTDGAQQSELTELRDQLEHATRKAASQERVLNILRQELTTQNAVIRQLSREVSELRHSRTWRTLTAMGGVLLFPGRITSILRGRAKGIVVYCDSPRPGSQAMSGKLQVRGWAVSRNDIETVQIAVNSGPLNPAKTGLVREDVGKHFPNYPNSATSGFRGVADFTAYADGPATIRIRVQDRRGRVHVHEVPIWVDNTNARRSPEQVRRIIASLAVQPLISIVVPVYNVAERWLRRCLDSVLAQQYEKWECCLANDAATDAHIRPTLEEYAARDPRFKVVHRAERGHIAEASNSALELARGDYVALLDCDDEITEHALLEMVLAINASPAADMLYSDEDKIDEENICCDAFHKPDWSPEYFHTCMYTCHLGVYRTSLVREVGGFRPEVNGAQDYDLALRIVSRTENIIHVPEILYHWRTLPTSTASGDQAKAYAHVSARNALRHYLAINGTAGEVLPGPSTGFHRIRFDICGHPKISIVIPTAGRTIRYDHRDVNLLRMCISSIRSTTTWHNYEIIAVDNGDLAPELIQFLEEHQVNRVTYQAPVFNLAEKMNLGAKHASGDHLVFLNDDIEVSSPDWLENMLQYSQQPRIGAVGAKLLFPNGNIQHAGIVLLRGNPGHPYYNCHYDEPGYFLSAKVTRNYLAVTGACVMTRTELFREVGGFNRRFPLNYNDVDYCLKLHDRGYRIVYTPYAELYHYESVSRDGAGHVEPEELELFKACWMEKYYRDPYYNPHLSLDHPYAS